MSYEGPIKLITDLNYKIIEDQERNIYKAVCSYGIDISKDELFKLLYDDRKQYDKGYSDGYAKAKEDTVLCKDCKHYKQSAVADRKMCFRKDVDGVEVCYDFQPYDSCTYGERKDEVEE